MASAPEDKDRVDLSWFSQRPGEECPLRVGADISIAVASLADGLKWMFQH